MAKISALPNQDHVCVLAADSTSMSTELLVEALSRDPQLRMIESPSSAQAVLHFVKQKRPHIAVVSAKIGESHGGGFELVREICTQSPTTRVIVLLDSSERNAVVQAFRVGARGVFCRTEPVRLLNKCIQCVRQGQVWANSSQIQFVLEALSQPTFVTFHSNGLSLLSARETDVVRCLAEGLTNREIALCLKLTDHTVKNYLFRIFDKLGVSSRLEVVLYALGNGVQDMITPIPTRRQTPQVATVA
jgi:DNA-binding NarL/FixJ family response regulator